MLFTFFNVVLHEISSLDILHLTRFVYEIIELVLKLRVTSLHELLYLLKLLVNIVFLLVVVFNVVLANQTLSRVAETRSLHSEGIDIGV